MDWKTAIQQHPPHTAVQRGGVTAWPRGASRLIGDSLGPILHLHDDASEIFYFIAGRCRMEVGNAEEIFEPGDFCLVPPLVPHNIWNDGDDDLVLLWLVAPNFMENKWRTDQFPIGAMDGKLIRAHVDGPGELPSDAQIRSAVKRVSEGDSSTEGTNIREEKLIYIIDGKGRLQLGGDMSDISAGSVFHVPSNETCQISSDSAITYLSCRAGKS